MKVSIIIPVYNKLSMTLDCLNDLMMTSYPDFEIILVDDGSKEPIFSTIKKIFPTIKVLKNEKNLGFAKAVNKGIKESVGDLVLLLNNDIRLPNNKWLNCMIETLHNDCLDITAPAGGRFDKKWNYLPGEATKKNEKYSFLPFWCVLIKRDVFNKIGLIPEIFDKGFFEDVLFCYKAKKNNFKLGICENTGVKHLYHQTFKSIGSDLKKEYEEKRNIFLKEIGFKNND